MRTLSSAVQAVLAGQQIPVRVIARLHLDSGTWGVSDHDDDFTWNSLAYRGFDRAFQVDIAPQSSGLRPSVGAMHLGATDPDVLATFFEESYRNRLVDVAFLIFDPATGTALEEVPIDLCRCGPASIDYAPLAPDQPEQTGPAVLSVDLEPISADLTRVNSRTRSDADQRLHRDPNDGFFKDTGVAGKSMINWGRSGSTSPSGILSAQQRIEQVVSRFTGGS